MAMEETDTAVLLLLESAFCTSSGASSWKALLACMRVNSLRKDKVIVAYE